MQFLDAMKYCSELEAVGYAYSPNGLGS
jgi:hypothetical protein